jgi:hypothetical protein
MTFVGFKQPREKRKIKPEPELLTAPIREWRLLREFPDYEISNDGRLRRFTAGSNTKPGAHIRAGLSKGGYPKYGVTYPSGRRVYRSAHRLVASEFLEPAPNPGMFVLHGDDNRLNCVSTNLRWGTPKLNVLDAKRNGRWQEGADHSSTRKPWCRARGSGQPTAKLDDEIVRIILSDPRKGTVIAKQYGVDSSLVYRIKKGKSWKHITDPAYFAMLEEGKKNDAQAT